MREEEKRMAKYNIRWMKGKNKEGTRERKGVKKRIGFLIEEEGEENHETDDDQGNSLLHPASFEYHTVHRVLWMQAASSS